MQFNAKIRVQDFGTVSRKLKTAQKLKNENLPDLQHDLSR
jgi:hypothetical protein